MASDFIQLDHEVTIDLYVTRADGTVEQIPSITVDSMFKAVDRFIEMQKTTSKEE